ncbi:MAG: hypothetical protein HY735_28335 [Verrucomicrobia bacterium]|nr:hypothetical protein [Verrucomicrobiota bacterium]
MGNKRNQFVEIRVRVVKELAQTNQTAGGVRLLSIPGILADNKASQLMKLAMVLHPDEWLLRKAKRKLKQFEGHETGC